MLLPVAVRELMSLALSKAVYEQQIYEILLFKYSNMLF